MAIVSRFATAASPDSPEPSRPRHRDHRAEAQTRAALTSARRPPSVLLRGGYVVTMDSRVGNFHGDILFRGDQIAAVGADLGSAASDDGCVVVDATQTIAMPGFVDSHLHAWERQLRGLAPLIDFPTYRQLILKEFSAHYRPHDVYVGTLVTATQALDGGVTTVIDNSHLARTLDHTRAAIEAVQDAGIRAVHAAGAPSFGGTEMRFPDDLLRLRDEYFSASDQLMSLRLYDHQINEDLWRFARGHDLWICHEAGLGMVANLDDVEQAGLLTHKHTFNHCIGTSSRDWDLISGSGAQVNLAPRSDIAFGLGPAHPPVDAALEHGVRPGLSMDNEVSYGLDMFIEMQTLVASQRSRAFEEALNGRPHRDLNIDQVLEFATLGGAANAGLEHRVGSLTPGKDADVILVNTNEVATAGVGTIAATLVGFANRSHVDTVFVSGRLRKWRGDLVAVNPHVVQAMSDASRAWLTETSGYLQPNA